MPASVARPPARIGADRSALVFGLSGTLSIRSAVRKIGYPQDALAFDHDDPLHTLLGCDEEWMKMFLLRMTPRLCRSDPMEIPLRHPSGEG
jgi:hypothetical protein